MPLHAAEAAKAITEITSGAKSELNLNKLSISALQSGVTNCIERINQVSNFLGYAPQAGALLMMPTTQPNQALISLALEVSGPQNAVYASATFAPRQSNGCGAQYDAVVYWGQACQEVGTQQFSGLKNIGTLSNSIAVLDGGVTTKIFLMPAGQGCVSIKKEIVL